MAGPIQLHLDAAKRAPTRMGEEIRRGLQAELPTLPSKYFYDDRGSELFELITQLPEYYQTRTEEALLAQVADDVVGRVAPRELVELGSGAGRKIGLLLMAMARARRAARLTMFDINAKFVADSVRMLQARFPHVPVRGLTGDFTGDLTALGPGGDRLAVLFAGTIGNLHPHEVPGFLSRVAGQLRPGDAFLVGVDVVKDPARLHAAYNDAAGITAAFNRNILSHLNAALGADFEPEAWAHVAFWDARREWIEMRLRATRMCRVRIPGARYERTFAAGDEIRTELSCKYTSASFARLLPGTNLVLEQWFTDPEQLFALALLRRNQIPLRLA